MDREAPTAETAESLRVAELADVAAKLYRAMPSAEVEVRRARLESATDLGEPTGTQPEYVVKPDLLGLLVRFVARSGEGESQE